MVQIYREFDLLEVVRYVLFKLTLKGATASTDGIDDRCSTEFLVRLRLWLLQNKRLFVAKLVVNVVDPTDMSLGADYEYRQYASRQNERAFAQFVNPRRINKRFEPNIY